MVQGRGRFSAAGPRPMGRLGRPAPGARPWGRHVRPETGPDQGLHLARGRCFLCLGSGQAAIGNLRAAACIDGRVEMATRDTDEAFLRSLLEEDEVEMSVVFSDPSLPDNPMIYVSDEFEAQTGYTPSEAVGRNCRFLQGPDTNPHTIEAIRQGLRAQTRFTIDILNYRKDGTPFVNRLRIRPIYDAEGRLMFFAGAQNPV
jgi:PAS domain S-box-containing protein